MKKISVLILLIFLTLDAWLLKNYLTQVANEAYMENLLEVAQFQYDILNGKIVFPNDALIDLERTSDSLVIELNKCLVKE